MEEESNCSTAGAAALPECFGDGDKVCPLDETGVMQPCGECLPCFHLRHCIQSVMVQRGKLRIVEDPPASKVTAFLKRWSDRKLK